MPRSERGAPAPMTRVALVAPETRLREMLVALADLGVVQLVGPVPGPQGEAVEALRRLERRSGEAGRPAASTTLTARPRPVEDLEADERRDLLSGEVELARRAAAAVRRSGFAALVGWVPDDELPRLTERLATLGAAAVELPRPRLVEPPTLLRTRRAAAPFSPLVETYGATRYGDIDPTPFAAASFVVMFGMMFGDVGHGLLLAGLGLLLHRTQRPRLAPFRSLAPFAIAGGLAAAVFGALYGEVFGPTGILDPLWLEPLEEPVELLAAGVAAGALLLGASYGIGVVNRLREDGLRGALIAPSGVAGFGVFIGLSLAGLGVLVDTGGLVAAGVATAAAGTVLLFAGFLAEAGLSASAVAESLVEVVDAVLRVGANLISFTRLAAFGLMHAALSTVVLDGATGLWEAGAAGILAGIVLFAVGTAAAFALEALVAGVQAMRLEYYELFSRIFAGQGEPFSPWKIDVVDTQEAA